MSGKLEGKVAIVTGGSRGIGLATAKWFVAEGAYVFITGLRQAELDAAVNEIGTGVTGVQGEVANPWRPRPLVRRGESEEGQHRHIVRECRRRVRTSG